jgi:hypothetical protein
MLILDPEKGGKLKHEWRKHEKEIYLPPAKPLLCNVPKFAFFSLAGEGNPNDDFFAAYIGALYSLSYALKMDAKKNPAISADDYTVYPLEGIWDLAKDSDGATRDFALDNLVFTLMIRQPDWVSEAYAAEIIATVKRKKPQALLDEVRFVELEEGLCVQMLHRGPYSEEPASFVLMAEYCAGQQLQRKNKQHREIYLSDARKVAPAKLKTVLRIRVAKKESP